MASTTDVKIDSAEGSIRLLTGREVDHLFSAEVAIESQREAFHAMGRGFAVLPDKIMLRNEEDGSLAFLYAARLAQGSPLVAKIGSVNPRNLASGQPSVSALIAVLDPVSGRPVALMDGTTVTTRRTAAATAVAIETLQNHGTPINLAVLGAGVQGCEHIRVVTKSQDVASVRLWSQSVANRDGAADILSAEIGLEVRPVKSPRDAVDGANVVILCTLSRTPLIEASWLAPGALVISIGSVEPDRCEIGQDIVKAANRIVVDDPKAAVGHAGPIMTALEAGTIDRDDVIGLGDIMVGGAPGRVSELDLIYYNSTGIGVQDAAAAQAVLSQASAKGVGLWLPPLSR